MFASLVHALKVHAPTDEFLEKRRHLLPLLHNWVAGDYAKCQGLVAGSDIQVVDDDPIDECTSKEIDDLRTLQATIWSAPATKEAVTFYRGAYVPKGISRRKNKTIDAIPMKFPFATSRSRSVAAEWAQDMIDYADLMPCVFEIRVPAHCPVLRISQSNVMLEDGRDAALTTQDEVVLSAGELRNVRWVQTKRSTAFSNRIMVCRCNFWPAARTPTQKRRRYLIKPPPGS